jgi:hypothetical protein
MRRLIFLAAIVALGMACETARAEYPYGYGSNYAPNYGYQVNNYNGGWYAQPYGYVQPYQHGFESFSEAAWRIRAEHSRARYFTHPLSLQNGPPVSDNSYGWGWGY